MRKILLIHSPRSGRWGGVRRLDAILRALADGETRVVPVATEYAGAATDIARAAAEEGAETVYAYGGDGTVRETAAGLLGSRCVLGVIPGGTANVVALALGLPRDPVLAAEALTRAEPFEIDVGLCNDTPFLMQVSCGLDAVIVHGVDANAKRRLGRAAFFWGALRELFRFPFPAVDLLVDGEPITTRYLAVCNLGHYGGPFRIAPEAELNDGKLTLVTHQGSGIYSALSFGTDLLRGARHAARPDAEIRPIETVEIPGLTDLKLQLDGDPYPAGPPVSIRLAPQTLRVLRPPV